MHFPKHEKRVTRGERGWEWRIPQQQDGGGVATPEPVFSLLVVVFHLFNYKLWLAHSPPPHSPPIRPFISHKNAYSITFSCLSNSAIWAAASASASLRSVSSSSAFFLLAQNRRTTRCEFSSNNTKTLTTACAYVWTPFEQEHLAGALQRFSNTRGRRGSTGTEEHANPFLSNAIPLLSTTRGSFSTWLPLVLGYDLKT